MICLCVVPLSYAQTHDQEIKVDLRTIGHEFLLLLQDSTSRVLPVEEENGRYAVRFEREFDFVPDFLVLATQKVMNASQLDEIYLVEVEECESHDLVYSYRATRQTSLEEIACRERELPDRCYVFYFTVIVNQEIQHVDPISLSETNSKSSVLNYLYLGGGLILLIGMIIYFKRRKAPPIIATDLIKIGQFQYDQKGMVLIRNAEKTELSSKESDLLFLLYSNENETLKREVILNQIWGDEGDYVGRTLDVFISKLRKKLEADSSLKIMNIRGVGYRFVMSEAG